VLLRLLRVRLLAAVMKPSSSCRPLPLAAALPSSLPAVELTWLGAAVPLLPLLPGRPLLPSLLSAAAPTSPMVIASAARCCSSAMRCAQ